jgi:hypothetical protein
MTHPIIPSHHGAYEFRQSLLEGLTMTQIPDAFTGAYTKVAHAAILAAARAEHDFGGWLAGVLASIAAELGSTEALTTGRPGSLGASLVQQLVKGTVGWDDDYLQEYRGHVS